MFFSQNSPQVPPTSLPSHFRLAIQPRHLFLTCLSMVSKTFLLSPSQPTSHSNMPASRTPNFSFRIQKLGLLPTQVAAAAAAAAAVMPQLLQLLPQLQLLQLSLSLRKEWIWDSLIKFMKDRLDFSKRT